MNPEEEDSGSVADDVNDVDDVVDDVDGGDAAREERG